MIWGRRLPAIALLITVCLGLAFAAKQHQELGGEQPSGEQASEEPAIYISVFHSLFEDESHSLLGNLTGSIRITGINGEAHAKCELLFLRYGPVDEIELYTSFMPFIFYDESGPVPCAPSIPAPPIMRTTLHDNERIVVAENSCNMSGFEEPMVFSAFATSFLMVHFLNGETWRWEYEYGVTPLFAL